jgi:hypothetical protein
VLPLNECLLLLLLISLSTQSGNFWIHPRIHVLAPCLVTWFIYTNDVSDYINVLVNSLTSFLIIPYMRLSIRSRGSSLIQRWAMGWMIGVSSRQGLGIFLFTTASKPALGPTQPPIQWVPGALSLGVKRLGRESGHSPASSAEVKEWVELYLHFPNMPSWRDAQLRFAQGQLSN